MKTQHRVSGFTLIELMITVAIIGILAAIAYPNYVSYVRQSKRAEAKSILLQAANREERFFTSNYEYTDRLTGPDSLGLSLTESNLTESETYVISVSKADKDGFTITATAVSDQAKDLCKTMTIDQTGRKTASNADCW